jgi:hypothetical protein
VFAWGLQYKLSLYDAPGSTSHQIPEAKLLSGNEQSAAVESPLMKSANGSPGIALALLFTVLASFVLGSAFVFTLMADRVNSKRTRPWCLARRSGLAAFFFRPPPVLA